MAQWATSCVAIAQGRIAAVEASIAGDAAETIDARGTLVVPGLIDIHTHGARTKEGPGLVLLCPLVPLDTLCRMGEESYKTPSVNIDEPDPPANTAS